MSGLMLFDFFRILVLFLGVKILKTQCNNHLNQTWVSWILFTLSEGVVNEGICDILYV